MLQTQVSLCNLIQNNLKGQRTYVFRHLVLELNVLGLEELFERLLLLTVKGSVDGQQILTTTINIPVDVTELVFSHAILQSHGDIKSPASRHRTTDTRHGDNSDILELNVVCRLGHED